MPLLAISLLALLAGTLLLMKIRKEQIPGKIFCVISWFFIVVGFLLFALFVAGGICKMKHHCCPSPNECRQELMMNQCHPGMPGGPCCPPGMGKRMHCMPGMMQREMCCPDHGSLCPPGCTDRDSTLKCSPKPGCAGHDSTMRCCPKRKP